MDTDNTTLIKRLLRLVKASREVHDLIINDESRYQAWQDEADELEQALLPFESEVN